MRGLFAYTVCFKFNVKKNMSKAWETNEMKDLLTIKNLLHDHRVKEAYCELLNETLETVQVIFNYKSLADVAFEMRNACICKGLYDEFALVLSDMFDRGLVISPGSPIYKVEASSPEHWIIAVVLAWEASK